MGLHGNASARLRRLVPAATMAAVLAMTLAACSTTGGTKHPPVTRPAVASPGTTPATTAPATPAGALSGTWSGQYSGAYHGTFKLRWQQSGSTLGGKIHLSAPPSTLDIHGTVRNGAIRFGTVGSVGITYSGTVSGSSMSGTYQVHGSNGAVGGPWSATKSS